MIKDFKLECFGPITEVTGTNLEYVNLFIGENSTGKTFLLKALYSMIRSREEFERGDDPRAFVDVLSEKLYWTFQVNKLGQLVQKGNGKRLSARISMHDNTSLLFSCGQDTQKNVRVELCDMSKRPENSVFLPPKEVLSLMDVILKAYQDKTFGFDATYSDLVLALKQPTVKGNFHKKFVDSRKRLEKIFNGKVRLEGDDWVYKKGNSKYSIHVTAEGVKKIAILDTLLGSRYLSVGSIIFIDEPESALHPSAISQFLDIVDLLSGEGIQFFISTHSYFVIKKLYLISLKNKVSIPTLIADEGGWIQQDLLDGMPNNSIIKESVRLFEQEMELSEL